MLYSWEVQTFGGHVSGHQHILLPLFECLNGFSSLLLIWKTREWQQWNLISKQSKRQKKECITWNMEYHLLMFQWGRGRLYNIICIALHVSQYH